MAIRALVIRYDKFFVDPNEPNNVQVALTFNVMDTSIPKADIAGVTLSISGAGTIAAFNNAIADGVRDECVFLGYIVPNNGVLLPQFVRF